MKKVKADLHIHTVLSPCADLGMSPGRIVQEARSKGLEMIAVTDHNSTRQAPEIIRMAHEAGLLAIGGAEVTTKEEVHCLALFENVEMLGVFQDYLDRHRSFIPNDPKRFGYQIVVNELEEIIYEEPGLLHAALDQSIDQVALAVHGLGGLFIPAHIDRPRFSLISQLGFIPPSLAADAFEITARTNMAGLLAQHGSLRSATLIRNSDAHYPEQIGTQYSELWVAEISFTELRLALHQKEGRRVLTQ